jgi:HK97 family phage major capsid protein
MTPVSSLTDAVLHSETRRLAEAEHITPAENTRLDSLIAEVERRQAKRNAPGTTRTPGYDGAPESPTYWRQSSRSHRELFATEARSMIEATDMALRAIEATVVPHGELAPGIESMVRQNPVQAERFRALADPAYLAGFMKLTMAGGDASRAMLTMTEDERAAFARANAADQRAMALSPDTAGGYGVPMIINPEILLSNGGATGSLRSIARVVTGVTDTYRALRSAGSNASWDAEAAEASDDSPVLANVDISPHRGTVFVPISTELFDDWEGLAVEMRKILADARDRLETDAFINGGGTTAPAGIVTRLDSNTNVEVILTTAGQLGVTDLYRVFAALPARHRSNATWLMSLDMQNQVRALGDDKLNAQTVPLSGDYSFNLMGRPVLESSAMPDYVTTTAAANLLVVGDFSNYTIFSRADARIELIPHLFGATNGRPTGQRGWYYSFRTGADVVNEDGFRLLTNT